MLGGFFDKIKNKFQELTTKDDEEVTEQTLGVFTVNALPEALVEGQTYKLKPLDAVLFAGNDPVANIIKKITLHEVVPRIDKPFHELWTHAGIIVDKTVLPLDCLEEGKLYLYESVFSGTVAGYVYSKVLPVDHPTKVGSFHLGPQIRDFAAVVNEGDSDVGICPLSPDARAFLEQRLKENPNLILDLYNKYKDFGYPITNILPVVASASKSLYEDLQYWSKLTSNFFPGQEEPKTVVFCSELVSIIYKEIGHSTFKEASPDTFTPLAVEVVPEFGSIVYYAKEDKVLLLQNGDTLSANPEDTRAQKLIKSMRLQDHWIDMPPGGGVPPNAQKAGEDVDGVELYVARVKIGSAFRLGKIRATDKVPYVNYFGREVQINYGHEVLASLADTEWVAAENGEVPENAVAAGVEEDGNLFYIARAPVGKETFLGFETHKGGYAVGGVAPHLGCARVPFDGEEVKAEKYQVLCHKD
ncbi:hypothetical protein BDR26DRAFT_933001 [Obelidium mucronatum]|nr:hypothetical protein BDR26DRAFT_945731 [Obelidium mucronatum]KAI9344062.1 hypothetical protein BDR26DRAFT_933001 [Obelidium mucronatum]